MNSEKAMDHAIHNDIDDKAKLSLSTNSSIKRKTKDKGKAY